MKISILACLSITLAAAPLSGVTLITEAFTGASAPGWTFVTGQGQGPSLTAATSTDQPGDGWLRLTESDNNQASFVYNDTALPTSNGLRIRFDFVIWREGSSSLADGFAVALFDANVSQPDPGGYGGSLGYAQRSGGIGGLASGVVGFGFDTFGNFSRASEGRIGGPEQRPNSFAIRGPMGDNRNEGYEYITGTEAGVLSPFVDGNSSRPTDVSQVELFLTADSKISVRMKRASDSEWTDIISDFQCDIDCPEEVMIGFTAGTGGSISTQEIRNLEVAPIPEPSFYPIFMTLGCALPILLRRRR